MKLKKEADFPKVITRGGVTVKIYHAERERGGRTYDEFTLAYIEAGRRVRKVFAEIGDARREADFAITKLTNGQIAALSLTGTEREEYVAAVAALKPTGRPLLTAISEYVKSLDLLGGKSSLLEAVEYHARHCDPDMPQKTVREVATEMLKAKARDGMSADYLEDLRYRLGGEDGKERLKRGKPRVGAFAKAFGDQRIAFIRSSELNLWLRNLDVAPRTRNNFRQLIVSLFNFAKAQGYLSKDRATEAEALAKAKVRASEIEIYKVSEIRGILSRLPSDLLAFAAIGAFAGLRTAEIERLEWQDVDFEAGFITVRADNAKTASRRLVPILPNLAAWLTPLRRKAGKVCRWPKTQPMVQRRVEMELEEAGVKSPGIVWKHNALRHSYISYRTASVQNVGQVALEAGNSPRMIFQSYRELVRPKDAAEYFAIMPPAEAGNVIQLGGEAAG